MAFAPPSTLMNEILDFLASTPTPSDIVAYAPSDTLVERSKYLHEQNRSGRLTDAEQVEFEELRRLNHFMNQLKIRAKLRIKAAERE